MKTDSPLITENMKKVGFTATVINYLNGTNTKLSTKTLSWEEFLAIWSAQKSAFSKTDFFTEWMKPIKSLSKKLNASEKEVMKKIESLVKQFPDYCDFFQDHLPVTHAIKFTDSFWELFKLWEEAGLGEKRRILHLIKITPKYLPQGADGLLRYWNMTEKFPEDRPIAGILITSMIFNEPREAFKLWREKIQFSETQIETLAVKMVNKKSDFDFDDLLKFFIQTDNTTVFDELLKRVDASTHPSHEFAALKGRTNEENKLKLLPLLYRLVTKMDIDNWWKADNFIPKHLPPYKRETYYLEIISMISDMYAKNMYGLTGDRFIELYTYSKHEYLISLYVKSIPLHTYEMFSCAMKAYALCGDAQIINTTVEKGIPLNTGYQLSQLVEFLDWLMKLDESNTYYINAIAKIKDCDTLNKKCLEDSYLSDGVMIARLMQHLEN